MLTIADAEQDLHLLCSESQFKASGFSAVQKLSTQIQTSYTTPIDTSQVGSVKMPRTLVDEMARSLLPENKTYSAIQPIKTTGDGNCLFNAASKSVCGNERMASELRLRTSFELINNQEFYSNHPAVIELKIVTQSGKLWPKASIYDVAIFNNITKKGVTARRFEEALQTETLVTLKKCAFSGILQIMGLASAINCTIKMIYPDKRHTLHELLNGTFKPRLCQSWNPVITIMWTNVGGWLDRTRSFHPNHFVPLLPVTGNCNVWMTVSSKNKRKRSSPSHTCDEKTDYPSATCSRTKKPGLRQLGDFFPSTLRTLTSFQDIKPSKADNPVQGFAEQSGLKQSDVKQSDLKQASKHPSIYFSSPRAKNNPPIIAKTETKNKSAEKKDSLPNKRRNSFHVKIPPKTNQSIHGSCNQSSLKQSTLDWSLLNNANSDLKNPTSKCEKSDAVATLGTKTTTKKPLSPLPSRKRSLSSVDNYDNLPPKKHHPHPVNNDHSNPKHSTPPNSAQSNPKHLSSSAVGKTSDMASTTKTTKKTLDQASNSFNSVDKQAGILSKQPVPSSTDLPLSGMRREFYNKRGKLFYKNSKRKHSNVSPQADSSGTQFRRSTIKGSLKSNKIVLENKLKTCKSHEFCSLNGTHLVANHLIKHGPIVATQELVKIYRGISGSSSQRRIMSSELFQILAKHLNIMQFTIEGKAFISENTSSDFTSLFSFINAQNHNKQNLNSEIEKSIGDYFRDAIKYMDSKRDRDTAIALLEKITSVNFVSKYLLGVGNKSRVQNCRENFIPNLNNFNNIRVTSQVVRNDMSNRQQSALTERIISKRKVKEILHVKPGRGRKLKCEENPNLAPLLEYAFMESGIQSHPRLTVDTLYRTPDSNVYMKEARELVLAMSDPSFSISLSSCYNYTQNYKKNTLQAKRHHDGKGVNACISLHQPPRIGVVKFALNLHWSSSNVNFLVDQAAEQPQDYFIDSKDAKSVVHGDITPVQKPMKTWKQREGVLPDHDWEQGRANAVTPMAHLFMETLYPEKLNLPLTAPSSGISVTRSGKGINLIYLSHYEPETVFRQLNEILFLMVQPCFDKYFRNAKTGKLKQNFIFIVDNGPSEQPSSTMVQLALVRLCKFLNIDRVVQVSFAEYNSKRNFVERVHPQVNKALSDHGPFCSHSKYPEVTGPGKEEHRENMEEMAKAVIECIKCATFGGQYLTVLRGFQEGQWVFNDEDNMRMFLHLSESNKKLSEFIYSANDNSLLQSLHNIWNINKDFKGCLSDDYSQIKNDENVLKTSWCDKYTTIIYRGNGKWQSPNTERFHRQPLPDYLRWLETEELHYLPYEMRASLDEGIWDSIEGCFLPTHILDMAYLVLPELPPAVIKSLGLLSWTTEEEVLKYYEEKKKETKQDMEDNFKKDQWRSHVLYAKKNKELIRICQERKLDVSGKKHELVERISAKQGEKPPKQVELYTGQAIPKTIKKLGKLQLSYLKSILRWYGLPSMGTKDSIILNVSLIANNRRHLCFMRERKMLLDLVSMSKSLIIEEKKQRLLLETPPTYRYRTFLTTTFQHLSSKRPRQNASVQSLHSSTSHIAVPEEITLINIEEIFDEFANNIMIKNALATKSDETMTTLESSPPEKDVVSTILTCGAIVKVFWSEEDCEETGWHEGWYLAVVKDVIDKEEALINISYVVEPECLYETNVTQLLSDKKVMLHEGSEIEEFHEVGCKVKVRWSKEEIGDSGWRSGWYVGEVQQSDPDNDEIKVVFQAEPDATYSYEVTSCLAYGCLQMVKSVL